MTGKSATPCENGLHLICLYVLKTEVFPVEAPVALAWGDLMALGRSRWLIRLVGSPGEDHHAWTELSILRVDESRALAYR